MTFSCSDFLDDVMRSLVHSQAITEAEIPADDPGKAADVATAAIVAMHRAGLFARFMRELLNAVETLGAIAETHGVDALVFLFDLQAAILNDTSVDAHAGIDGRIVELVSQLPSAAQWMKHIRKEGHEIALIEWIANRQSTPVSVQPVPTIRVRADGDANFYHLLDGEDWVAAVQMNGRFTVPMQEAMLQTFAGVLRNPCGPHSPDMNDAVPHHVRDRVKWALSRLREHEAALQGVQLARGNGHILALELKDREEAIRHAMERINEFRGVAAKDGVDAEAFIHSIGGLPDLERFGYRTS
ncbi:hypothetical protein [Paraburkholderia atlantica]|uniref:hypothetical protein n=1 Tax=Paraburkholderia atlantica TaxID=2654982 RepID=UPI0017AB0AF8|nr:hypothetical protein [Paraburkholderia atlantica]MBB5511171.1 putative nucleic acid-binding Zn-ribbon protein [Paraburkholderia atlantica]